jgi:hypothetical protein
MPHRPFHLRRHILCGSVAALALLSALVLPVPAASAATTTPQPAAAAHNSTTTKNTDNAALKPTGANEAKPVPQPRTRPAVPAPAELPAAPSAAATSTARASAAKAAIAQTAAPDTCSGVISPDTVYPCDTPSASGTDTFTVNLADSSDLLIVQVLSTSGRELPFAVTAPDGSAVACSSTSYGQIPQCATSASGGYTVAVTNQGTDYTISYMPLLSDTTCAAIDPSFAAAPIEGSVAAGAVGSCYTLDVPSGDTVFGNFGNGATSYLETLLTIYDSTGAQICFDSSGTCALTGSGPYRVLVDQGQGAAFTYGLELDDLTDPTGCVATAPESYGTAPDDSSADECRELTVSTAGEYQVYGATTWQDGAAEGVLYTASDTVACTNSGAFCQLSAGTYYYVDYEDPLAPYDFAMVFIAANTSGACAQTGDTDFATGPAAAKFSGIGEVDCLDLPTASGRPVYIYDENVVSTPSEAPLLVVDATGAQQCTGLYDGSGVCTPTGTAPFRVLVASQRSSNTGYKVLIQATDSTAGCADWPQSGFGGSWGARVKTSFTSNVACVSIPASQHSTGEMIDYADTTNTEDGDISVNDATGTPVCQVFTTATCTYTAGVTYTAIVSNSGQNQTYHFVRRDVTQSAPCAAAASTTVGGPSTGFNLTSDIDATCYRVTTDAASDDMWFDVRALAPYPAGAILLITDGAGTSVCPSFASLCQISGSTDYQVITIASGYAGVTIPVHLDTWQVTTSAGPAAQCAANPLSVNGWAPISGTLTESDTAYCATVSYQPDQDFDVYSALPDGTPLIDVYPLSGWSPAYPYSGICAGGFDGEQCTTPDASGTAVLLVTLRGSQSPTNFTVQGVCILSCTGRPGPATISTISPDSQPAGTANEVTVTGTNLNLGTEVMLATAGDPVSGYWISTPVSVNAAGTQVTVVLNTSAVTPGTYDIMLDADYYESVTSPGYLSGAYTVTAAPQPPAASTFVSVTPSRILDTTAGVGAAKARVAADGTVTLNVEGVGGVPTSQVTAVALDLTAVDPASGGDLVAYADGSAQPGTSNLDFVAGKNATNLVIVPVTDGQVDIYNASSGAVDLTGDVDGYYTTAASTGSLLTTVTPTAAQSPARVAAHGTLAVPVDGVSGLPTSGVTAVELQVGTVRPQSTGSLTAYADGTGRPAVTDASFVAGHDSANLIVVQVTDGKVDLYNNSAGPVGLTASIEGYFSGTGSGYVPLSSAVRVLDTRSGLGGAGETVQPGAAALVSLGGVAVLPVTVTAVVLNLTEVGAQDPGAVEALTFGGPVTGVAGVDFPVARASADLTVEPWLYADIEFYNSSTGTIQLVADFEGYYTSS